MYDRNPQATVVMDISFVIGVEKDGSGHNYYLTAVEGPNYAGEDYDEFYDENGDETSEMPEEQQQALVEAVLNHFGDRSSYLRKIDTLLSMGRQFVSDNS